MFVFISGNCLAHCVIAKLAANGWFCIYLCSFQEFAVKQALNNKIISKLNTVNVSVLAYTYEFLLIDLKLSQPSGFLLPL